MKTIKLRTRSAARVARVARVSLHLAPLAPPGAGRPARATRTPSRRQWQPSARFSPLQPPSALPSRSSRPEPPRPQGAQGAGPTGGAAGRDAPQPRWACQRRVRRARPRRCFAGFQHKRLEFSSSGGGGMPSERRTRRRRSRIGRGIGWDRAATRLRDAR